MSFDPIDRNLVSLLRADRAALAPPGARARVGARLGTLLTPPDGAAGDPSGGAPVDGSGGTSAAIGAASAMGPRALAVVAFLVGGGAGAGLHHVLTSPPEPRVVYVERPSPPAAAPSTAPTAQVPAQSNEVAARPAPSSMARSASPPAAAAPSSDQVRAAQLRAERALLDEARTSLIQADAAHALDLLDRHAKTFARAMLIDERDALTVQALVKLGRHDEARARADAFRSRAPGSLLLPAVDAALRSIP